MSSLEFDVFGVPESQGSVRGFARKGGKGVILTSDNDKLASWRQLVTVAAIQAKNEKPDGWVTLDGGVAVQVTFYMHRPQSEPKTIDTLPIRSKDIDKCLRAILDSLTNAAIIADDSRVVRCWPDQVFAVGPHLAKIYDPRYHRAEPGAHILVRSITREEMIPWHARPGAFQGVNEQDVT